MIDEQVDRYVISEIVGIGGMAKVYKAYDARFKRHVAIKMLDKEYIGQEYLLDRFEQEAQVVATLEHHAIVPVYDIGEFNGAPYLVMRLMTGGSLKERIDKGPLSLASAAAVLNRVCSALDKAHANNVVHRDIKPANILFDDENMAFLADFGIARLTAMTQSGTIVGSPHYMSPEQARGQPVDGRTDVYQLGVMLYEMLTGRLPFDGERIDAVVYQHVHGPIPKVGDERPDLPRQFQNLLDGALAKQMEDRIPTAGELALRFQLMVDHSRRHDTPLEVNVKNDTVPDPPEDFPPTEPGIAAEDPTLPEPPRRRRWARWAFGTVGLLALAATAILFSPVASRLPDLNLSMEALPGASFFSGLAETNVVEDSASEPVTDLVETPLPTEIVPTPTLIAPDVVFDPASLELVGGGSGAITYAANRNGNYDIYVLGSDGFERQLTTIEVDDFRPIWSPDGSQIAYHSFRNNWEVYVMDADGTNKMNLSDNPADDSFPQWSPSGSEIVFHSNRDGLYNIFIMDTNGENARRLTNNGRNNYAPVFSPDGQKIAFESEIDGVRQIILMDSNGTNQEQITFDIRYSSYGPQWSPNGQLLAFYSSRGDGISSVYTANSDGSSPVQITNTVNPAFYPSWSPNSEWLIFHENVDGTEEGNRDLWLVRADGSERLQLTDTVHQERMPHWQP